MIQRYKMLYETSFEPIAGIESTSISVVINFNYLTLFKGKLRIQTAAKLFIYAHNTTTS